MVTIVIASHNKGKIKEIREILGSEELKLLDFNDFPDFPHYEEHGATFEENAVHKARKLAEWSGYPAIADDSGLEVVALGGAPGVHSARYAGPLASPAENNQKLLRALVRFQGNKRSARFICTAVYAEPGGRLLVAKGVCEGHIARAPRGTEGFGYDPLFVPRGYTKTLAELQPGEKNKISHRGRAFKELRQLLEELRHER